MRNLSGVVLLFAVLPFASAMAQVDEQVEIDWQTNAADYRDQFRKSFNVYCPPGGRSAAVWGKTIYTDDSSICSAAVHALATFDFARGGTVYFAMEPGQEGYDAEPRRGVATQEWGAFWAGSFRIVAGVPGKKQNEITDGTPVEITWATTARHFRFSPISAKQALQCPRRGVLNPVWGSDVYTDDSPICAAAVHAGLITPANGGGVTVRTEPGRENYGSSRRNGVASIPWERWDGSFSLPRGQTVAVLPVETTVPEEAVVVRGPAVAAPVMRATMRGASGELLLNWNTPATEWRSDRGQVHSAYCPADGRAATVWGSTIHTDDSSICTAAVYSLATFSFQTGGTVHFEMTNGRNAYSSAARHGVTVQAWGPWESSFRIVSGAPGKRPNDINEMTELEIGWSTTVEQLRSASLPTRVRCAENGELHSVWGSDNYSANSSICSAAVHAGLIKTDIGGAIAVAAGPTRAAFTSTTRNGVATQSLNNSAGSFSFRR